jgi:predicted TIM-barrel fold metal-dependent hydrolase
MIPTRSARHREGAGLGRRDFLRLAGTLPLLALGACNDDDGRYTDEDVARLERQRREERTRSGRGPFGRHVYAGYRGLADLPWFELDARGKLRCVVEDLPPIIDVHAHFGIALLFAPEIDLQARVSRVRHLLDCDRGDPGCRLDLDVYINANFTDSDLRELRWQALTQMLWGSSSATTHTIPNLLDEMDATRVQSALILPIAFGLPFGDGLTERWIEAIERSGDGGRLLAGASVHPRDPERSENLRRYAALGARAVKLHPTMQRFYPDEPDAMATYAECARLGLPVVFHGGRAGIEPGYMHPFAVIRHYEGAFRRFPELPFVLGHAGARDVAEAIELAARYPNVWLDIHGQGVTVLAELIERVGSDRLLFGTDWPFYHLAASLAKVLIVTDGRPDVRDAILHANAARLLALGPAGDRAPG